VGRDNSHDITRREREKERGFRVFLNNKKNLQKVLMEFGNLPKNNLMQFWMSTNFH
jgi:hypothetical protein